MFKDTKVLWFHTKTFREVKIMNEKFLPFPFRGLVTNTPDHISDIEEFISIGDTNYDCILTWLSSRLLSLNRNHAKQIYTFYHFEQTNSIKEKAMISIKCRAVSILDCFWLKDDEEDHIKWKEVDVKAIRLEELVFDVALKGYSATKYSNHFVNPEIGTFGVYAKAWKREKDGLYLYKTGEKGDSYPVQAELAASYILGCLNVNRLKYEPCVVDGLECTRCKCMSDDTYSLVSASVVKKYYERNGGSFYDWVKTHFASDYEKMVQVDYLIWNYDRHLENWGFLLNNATFELEALHPLYDHNNAFCEGLHDHAKYAASEGGSMFELAAKAFRKYPIQILKPILYKEIDSDHIVKMLLERLDKLGVSYKANEDGIYSCYCI